MNKRQRWVVLVGITLVSFMLLFPPWVASFSEVRTSCGVILPAEDKAIGYGPMWSTPAPPCYNSLNLSSGMREYLGGIAKQQERSHVECKSNRQLGWRVVPLSTEDDTGLPTEEEYRRLNAERSGDWGKTSVEIKALGDDFSILRTGPLAVHFEDRFPSTVKIDTPRLLLQCLIAALLSSGLFIYLGKPGKKAQAEATATEPCEANV